MRSFVEFSGLSICVIVKQIEFRNIQSVLHLLILIEWFFSINFPVYSTNSIKFKDHHFWDLYKVWLHIEKYKKKSINITYENIQIEAQILFIAEQQFFSMCTVFTTIFFNFTEICTYILSKLYMKPIMLQIQTGTICL